MQTLQKKIDLIKFEQIRSKPFSQDGERILVIGDREYIQGPAFVKRWKQAAVDVCVEYLEQDIPSLVVETEDYYTVWTSRAHTLGQLDEPVSSSSARYRPRSLKKWLGIGLPLLIVSAVAGVALLRSRDACRIALDGASYHPMGLSQWVMQSLKQNPQVPPSAANSITVSQYGCTVVVRGHVPNIATEQQVLNTVKGTQVFHTDRANWFTQLLGVKSSAVEQPVSEVVNQLQVQPQPKLNTGAE